MNYSGAKPRNIKWRFLFFPTQRVGELTPFWVNYAHRLFCNDGKHRSLRQKTERQVWPAFFPIFSLAMAAAIRLNKAIMAIQAQRGKMGGSSVA